MLGHDVVVAYLEENSRTFVFLRPDGISWPWTAIQMSISYFSTLKSYYVKISLYQMNEDNISVGLV
jgi:hypothetical protein